MTIYLPEEDEIYFPKTKEYFKEVMSSYSIGNYRSATVMLYSIAICDLLFKLQELKDMYNDNIAVEILKNVEKLRNANYSRSKWEQELVDEIYEKTSLLNLESYTNIMHLYDYRNFSAHPALNDNYELIEPSRETTIANIKNILKDVLIKPPIFITSIIDKLTEDLKDKKEIYKNEHEKLAVYLNNKYFDRMTVAMKLKVIKTFWKFCFCMPDDLECQNNVLINRSALEILIGETINDVIPYIKDNQKYFTVANSDNCQNHLIVLLSKYPEIYAILDSDTILQIDKKIDTKDLVKPVAWFKFGGDDEHIGFLKKYPDIKIAPNAIRRMEEYYNKKGDITKLIDYFVWYYGNSPSFYDSDIRFANVIEPYLKQMSAQQLVDLIEFSDSNDQIWGRRGAIMANNTIIRIAKDVLESQFDYAKYERFKFDSGLLAPTPPDEGIADNDYDFEIPF